MPIESSQVLTTLQSIAPLQLAGSWDNVGVLIEPHESTPPFATGLLTIDLTERVLDEAISLSADLIIAYHPIMFGGIKALRQSNPHTRMVMKAVRHGITVYAPHTALDAVSGGVNDWLIGGLGNLSEVKAIEPAVDAPSPVGMGRIGRLSTPLKLTECIARMKAHLEMEHLRVAAANQKLVEIVAVCPGAGGQLLAPLREVDLVITGEMRHHDVLALNERGTSVLLTDHTNSERGYLPRLAETLNAHFGSQIAWHIATEDHDPLAVV